MSLLKNLYDFCQKIRLFNVIERKLVNAYMLGKHHITVNNFETWMKTSRRIQKVNIDDMDFEFVDNMSSNTIDIVSEELHAANTYDFSELNFSEGDVVIDIGANIGIISIFLAKKFPFLKIYSYEPVSQNYNNFVTNIRINKIPDGVIFPHNMAVTSDGRNVDMSINTHNYGGSSISDVISVGTVKQECNTQIKSTTLKDIIAEHNIGKLKLLKIDCEGSEYEILYNTPENVLSSIEMIRGEFHENKELTDKYDIDSLLSFTQKYVKDVKIEPARNCFIV